MPKKIELNVLIFELTDDCNQYCKFCYNHWKESETQILKEKSSFRQAKKVLKTVFKQANVNSISFSGGEPLLMQKIADLVFYAHWHKANVSILTNGTLLTSDLLENFTDLGVRRIQIPLLSVNPNTHDALTQLEGSWTQAVEAAKNVMARNPDWFNAVLVLSKQNANEIDDILQFYKRLGVKNVLVNRFNVGGLGRKYQSELNLSHSELRDAFRKIDDFALENDMRFYSGVCTPMCVLNPADYRKIAFSFCNKNILLRPITINYKGDVRFCNHSPRVLGNVFEKPLAEILLNEDYDAYFNTTPDYCANCELLIRCGGGCRAASEQVYNTFAKVDPVVEI
jgi:radical SAM protein with 4Fe4S-binding SPASM domain